MHIYTYIYIYIHVSWNYHYANKSKSMLPLLQAKSPGNLERFPMGDGGPQSLFPQPLMCVVAKHLATLDGHEPRMVVSGFHLGFLEKGGGYTKPSYVGIILKKNIIRIPTNKKKGREGKSRTWSGVQGISSMTLCRIQNSFEGWWMWVDVNFELWYSCYIHVISRLSQSSNSWYCDRTKAVPGMSCSF